MFIIMTNGEILRLCEFQANDKSNICLRNILRQFSEFEYTPVIRAQCDEIKDNNDRVEELCAKFSKRHSEPAQHITWKVNT